MREAAILFTFALGTAAGDLFSEQFGLGYLASGLIVGAVICAIAALHYGVNFDACWHSGSLTSSLGHWAPHWEIYSPRITSRAGSSWAQR